MAEKHDPLAGERRAASGRLSGPPLRATPKLADQIARLREDLELAANPSGAWTVRSRALDSLREGLTNRSQHLLVQEVPKTLGRIANDEDEVLAKDADDVLKLFQKWMQAEGFGAVESLPCLWHPGPVDSPQISSKQNLDLKAATLPPEAREAAKALFRRLAADHPELAAELARECQEIAESLLPPEDRRTLSVKQAMEITGLKKSRVQELPEKERIGKLINGRLRFSPRELQRYMAERVGPGRPPKS